MLNHCQSPEQPQLYFQVFNALWLFSLLKIRLSWCNSILDSSFPNCTHEHSLEEALLWHCFPARNSQPNLRCRLTRPPEFRHSVPRQDMGCRASSTCAKYYHHSRKCAHILLEWVTRLLLDIHPQTYWIHPRSENSDLHTILLLF